MQKTIFVVDDSIVNLSLAEKVLEEQYEVITMTSAAKMFLLMEKIVPDLILLDVAMPELSGFDALKQLKTNNKFKDIPVIFLTALTDSYNEAYGIELGAVDFITKPFSAPVLLHRIKHHLDIDELIKERTEQANAASKAKSDFLSNMNHEMRTPLNAIIGMTLLGKEADSMEEAISAFNKIGDASSHLLTVISDVLDMVKIETDQLELMPVEFNFHRLLQKAMTNIKFRIDAKKQNLKINIDNNIPHFITGDEQRLMQVIVNLLSNAAKFTPIGGNICIDASLLGEKDGLCDLRVEVTDNGIGISAEQQEKLFQPFVQAESGISRKYSGTGLGLIISKRIVELMEGRIWIESELGKGSKFIFTIKVQRGKKSLDKNHEEQGSETGQDKTMGIINEFAGRKMLLADDVEINREILMTQLEKTGIEIDCAENGQEVLEMIRLAPDKYDIVFMDVQMPKMDGYEATRQIRDIEEKCPDKKIPIIAMTTNVSCEDIKACLAAGMSDHLGKPLDIDRVFEILCKYL